MDSFDVYHREPDRRHLSKLINFTSGHISEGKAPFVYVKNFTRVRASCLLALFCVTETSPSPILQPKEKLNTGKNPNGNKGSRRLPVPLFCVQGFVLPQTLLSTRADPHAKRPARQMCWNSGEPWWPPYSPGGHHTALVPVL